MVLLQKADRRASLAMTVPGVSHPERSEGSINKKTDSSQKQLRMTGKVYGQSRLAGERDLKVGEQRIVMPCFASTLL